MVLPLPYQILLLIPNNPEAALTGTPQSGPVKGDGTPAASLLSHLSLSASLGVLQLTGLQTEPTPSPSTLALTFLSFNKSQTLSKPI